MKRLASLWAAFLLVLFLAAGVPASETARTFIEGTQAYRNGDWSTAIDAFETLAAQGVDNGQLFYNLGNAYLKSDDLGRALLWYERALKRIPDDPDLRFNYDYALTLTKDERAEQKSPLVRILFFWKFQLTHATICWVAVSLNAALWMALSILTFRKKRRLRPFVVLLALVALLFSATALFNYIEGTHVRHAVVLPDEVAVRSGFSDSATQLFLLHAGTKVRVERESDTHMMVRYTADKIGWVKKGDVGVI